MTEGLHWYPELEGWGRWDVERGAVEPKLMEGEHEGDGGERAKVVLVSEDVLRGQLEEGGQELVQLLDRVWARNSWDKRVEKEEEGRLVYRRGSEEERSGWMRGARKVDLSLRRETRVEIPGEAERAVEFICWQYLPMRDESVPMRKSSADAKNLRSYFEEEDERCLEVTPAFFKASVLDKYLNDPERYTVTEHAVTSKNEWTLDDYDINDKGQVHAYLVRLGRLPPQEQRYWQSFNEKPRAGISEWAYTTGILGDYGKESDTARLKRFAERQVRKGSEWWKAKDMDAVERYLPCTNPDAMQTWKNSIVALHQIGLESLNTR